MKKIINLYLVKNVDTKKKILDIKKAGFDGITTGLYDSFETMTFEEQMQFCKINNINVPSIHCSYNEPNLKCFWLEGSAGNEIESDLANQIIRASKYGSSQFVVHLNGDKNPPCTEVGLARINRLLKICKKYKIFFAIENLYCEKQIDYIFNNINNKRLTICYDYGHEKLLTPNANIVSNYASKISCLHLHTNNGITDEHSNFEDENELKRIAKTLCKISSKVPMCLEVSIQKEKYNEQYLKNCFDNLTKLEKYINAFKN